MILPKMQLTKISGVDLEILDTGSGEPVMFVHGGMGDECFAVLEEPALTSSYRLIHYHRRGWGNSERPETPLSISQQAADCKGVLQHLGIEKAHLVGQSYGGAILLQFALDAPEFVYSLALLEPALPSVLFNSAEFGAGVAKAMPLYESGNKAGAIDGFGQEVAGTDYRVVCDQTMPPGYFERWVADADTLFQFDFAALQSWTFTAEDATRITQPVINMSGAGSKAYFREIYETIQTWLPNAENFIVPNSTHCMLQMNPKAVAERLASFYSKHSH